MVLGGWEFSYERGTPVPRSSNNFYPEDPTVGQCLGAYGGPRGAAFSHERGIPCMDHMARPRKHRLGAIGAIGGLLIIVSQPRTIGDPERDQPHDGHGPPPGAERKREREREGKRERERRET